MSQHIDAMPSRSEVSALDDNIANLKYPSIGDTKASSHSRIDELGNRTFSTWINSDYLPYAGKWAIGIQRVLNDASGASHAELQILIIGQDKPNVVSRTYGNNAWNSWTDINSKVTATRLSYDTLINEADGGTTTQNIPTYNGRKFSDYNLIIATVVSGSINHSPCILPEYVFRTQGGMQIDYSTDTVPRYASIVEQSDTTAYVSGNVSGSKVNVYGVRIVKE